MTALRPLLDASTTPETAHRAEYERGLVEHVGMPRSKPRRRSRAISVTSSRTRFATASTWIWAVEDDGRVVGTIFLGVRDGGAWLYDITIAEDARRKGYGRAAMTALEDEVRALGHDKIGLNVWGGNDVARGLYRSLGWAEASVQIRRKLYTGFSIARNSHSSPKRSASRARAPARRAARSRRDRPRRSGFRARVSSAGSAPPARP